MKFKLISYCLFIIVFSFFVGCDKSEMQQRLAEIDHTVNRELKDTTAYNMLKNIDMAVLDTEADSAYYYLLKTQIFYKLFMPVTSDSMINFSIRYYEKSGDEEKMARSYYYKGATIYELGRTGEAVVCIKKAEYLAANINDDIFNHKIYQLMTLINGNANELLQAIKYAKKQYNSAKVIGKNEWIASALVDMGITYSQLNYIDSARNCLAECQQYINKMPKDEQAFYYTTLGEVYMKDNPEMAKLYFQMALKSRKLPKTYKCLADLYIQDNEREKAKTMWEDVLNTAYIPLKIEALFALQKMHEEEKNYESALKIAKRIIVLKDSAQQKKDTEQVSQLQTQYDAQMRELEKESNNRNLIFKLIAIASVLGIFAIYNQYFKIKNRRELDENRDKIAKYQERIQELEDNGEAASREAKSLHDKLGVLRDRQINLLNKGKSLYDHISRGGNLVHWDKVDMMYYIEYYRTVHPDLIRSLEVDYDSLTPRQKILMTLYDMRKTESDMATIMAIGITSVRSMKTRIKQRKIVK